MEQHRSPGMRPARANGSDRRIGVRLESLSTRWAITAFAAGGVITVIVMFGSRWPLADGDLSVGNVAAWITAAFAGLAFASAFVVEARRGYDSWRRGLPMIKRILDLVAMSLAMAMLSYLIVLAVASLFQLGFHGLTIDPWGGGALAGAAAATFTYVAVLAGARVTSEGLSILATLVIFVGTISSMLSAPDQSWWQLHFSKLGNNIAASGYRFNLSLILTGLVITVLANYVAHDIELGLRARKVEPEKRVRLFAWVYAGIGIGMAVAGSVPDDVSFPTHVSAATGMVVMVGIFVFLAFRYLPGLPRDVAVFSLLALAGVVVAVVLWVPIGYYNLTGMEFIAAGLLFAWLTVFVRAMEVYARPPREAL
ncbi:DUF998 domain-containing protein [Microbacterium sp. ASV49]|uniref:DUF998 domain-containing protein n=1 Tax=Microbacterium candidum TaxID=3041922 RepID=A0ABT7MVF7_9MICO|nr:DUF998 domain-containing protein [Microbacterium sp. ASV49]MDL9978442.1 DUF998 domain-containing protein [Microbacterium sp. ASV49]